jgi:hypothetical protein
MKHEYRISLMPYDRGILLMIFKGMDASPCFEKAGLKSTDEALQLATAAIYVEEKE